MSTTAQVPYWLNPAGLVCANNFEVNENSRIDIIDGRIESPSLFGSVRCEGLIRTEGSLACADANVTLFEDGRLTATASETVVRQLSLFAPSTTVTVGTGDRLVVEQQFRGNGDFFGNSGATIRFESVVFPASTDPDAAEDVDFNGLDIEFASSSSVFIRAIDNTGFDHFQTNGDVSIEPGARLLFDAFFDLELTVGQSIMLVDCGGELTGTFDGLAEGEFVGSDDIFGGNFPGEFRVAD